MCISKSAFFLTIPKINTNGEGAELGFVLEIGLLCGNANDNSSWDFLSLFYLLG